MAEAMNGETDSTSIEHAEQAGAGIGVDIEPASSQESRKQDIAPDRSDEEWGSTPSGDAEEVSSPADKSQPADEAESKPEVESPPGAAHDQPRPQVEDESNTLAAFEAELAAEAADEELDDILAGTPTGWQGELPELLMRIVDARISVWRKLLEMDAQRKNLDRQAKAREIREELARQARELKNCPNAEVLQRALPRQQALLQNPTIKGNASPDSGSEAVDQNQLYRIALQMGIGQIALLQQRLKLDAAIPSAALPAAATDPLLVICRKHGLNGDPLIGWTYYALGVQQRIDGWAGAERDYRAKLAEARAEDKESGRGLGGLFRGTNKEDEVGQLDEGVREGLLAASRELQAVEPRLTEMFWALYEDVAWAFTQGKFDEDERLVVRAFLRYGLVSAHPGLISPDKLEFILKDCREDVYEWQNAPQATHVVYADEYISAIASRNLTVSPDENLELNGRGSDVWKADRVWRQAVICKVRSELFSTRLAEIKELVERKQAETDRKLEQAGKLRALPKKIAVAKQLEKQALMIKPAVARLRHAAEHIEARIIPKIGQQATEAAEKLAEAAKILTEEMIVRREAKFIRYMARLVGRLKEPFAQFVLRDHFKPNGNDHNSRKVVIEAIKNFEANDRRVFHHTLVPNKRLDRQVAARMSPAFLLPPGRGQMGLAVCQRKWDDNGRIVMPMLAAKAGDLENLLVNLMADFRWDCSKEEAGMDWIVADALCAAYASVRWNMRKVSDKSQKTMGFNFRLKDKANFRIHYGLFVNSARQGGRLLFSRSDDVYKALVRYVGLPPGVKVLKRD